MREILSSAFVERAIEELPCRAVEGQDASPKERAFAILAEMLLMQHTCHWYCRSKSVASDRMHASHRTSYAQLVGAVLPQTRQEYLGLVV